MPPDLYPASGHMLGAADVYPPSAYLPRPAHAQHANSHNYLPSVSYSLDHLDRLEFQVTSGLVLLRRRPVGLKVLNVASVSGSGNAALPAQLRELPDWLLQLRRGGAGGSVQAGEQP